MLDRYELIAELASGGMATVYLARLAGVGGFQRLVAVKRLHPHLNEEPEFVQMFLDEARLAASIHHPHVVPILEVGTSAAGYYVVMEYIEGDTLAKLVSRHRASGSGLPAPIVMRIALDTLAGLHAAHELTGDDGQKLSLVHRDVSPQNILVGVDGSARLTDFGVARASSRLASTQSGTLKGKLAYMPPEQAKGDEGIDRRADIFAMAIVVWELFASKRLFRGTTELETLNKLMFEPIPRLSSVIPTATPALDEALTQALERDPARRYATAADFADALERAAEGPGGVATVRQVADFVESTLGSELTSSRSAVRAFLAECTLSRSGSTFQIPPNRPSAGSTGQHEVVSSPSVVVQLPPPPAPAAPHTTLVSPRYEGPPRSVDASPPPSTSPSVEFPVEVIEPARSRSKGPILAVVGVLLVAAVVLAVVLSSGASRSTASAALGATSAVSASEPPMASTSALPIGPTASGAASAAATGEPVHVDAFPTEHEGGARKAAPGSPPAKPDRTKGKAAEPPKPTEPARPPPKPAGDDYKNPYR